MLSAPSQPVLLEPETGSRRVAVSPCVATLTFLCGDTPCRCKSLLPLSLSFPTCENVPISEEPPRLHLYLGVLTGKRVRVCLTILKTLRKAGVRM